MFLNNSFVFVSGRDKRVQKITPRLFPFIRGHAFWVPASTNLVPLFGFQLKGGNSQSVKKNLWVPLSSL